MERFSRSWALAKQSWEVLKANKQLMLFPALSGLLTLIVTASFFIPVYMAEANAGLPHDRELQDIVGYPVMAAFYFVCYFIVIFCNSALVACTASALAGRPMTFGEGMSAAFRRIGPILGWTLVATTVGVILQTISERSGIVGKIVVGLFGAAWSVVTFFVIPVMVLDGVGPIESVKKSGSLLRKTWGENIIGNAGIGLVIGILSLLMFIPIMFGIMSGSGIGVFFGLGIGILYLLALAIIGSALTGIYQTALYLYANSGTPPNQFSGEYITGAFTSKETKKSWLG